MSFLFKFLRDNKVYVVIWALLFIFFILAPMSGDDYVWSFDYLRSGDPGRMFSPISWMYESINGRVVGNALEFFLVSYPLLSSIVRSSIMIGIVYAFCKITKIKNPVVTSLVALLVCLPPPNIFRQAIVWSAGFYNYTVPILLLMLIYLIIASRRKNQYIHITLFLLSLIASLFSENVTLVTLGLFCVYGATKLILRKRADIKIIISGLGFLFGALIMFSSPIYIRVAAGADGYRTLSVAGAGFFSRLAENAHDLSGYLVFDMLYLYIILFAVITLFYIRNLKKRKPEKNSSLVISGMSLILLMFIEGLQKDNGRLSQYLMTFITWVFFAAFIMGLLNYVRKIAISKQYRYMIIGSVTVAILYVMPFLLVTPFGPRNFYITYILILISIIIALKMSLRNRNLFRINHRVVYVAASIIAAIIIGFMAIIRIVYENNESKFIKQVNEGKTTIYLQSYPIAGLIHDGQSSKKQTPYYLRRFCVNPICKNNSDIEIIYK